MNERAVRSMVINALHKTAGMVGGPALAAKLQDPETDVAIAALEIDSLDGIEWCMEIEAQSGVDLDPVELTTLRSINELVGLIVKRGGLRNVGEDLAWAAITRGGPLPLSLAEESIWNYSQSSGTSAAYALSMRDRFLGKLDIGALRDCLSEIVRRHEILRTTFSVLDGKPVKIVHPAEPVALPVIDLRHDPAGDDAVAQLIKADRAKVTDLSRLPLIRFTLIRMSDDEYCLIRVCHHILWDPWSAQVLLDEIAVLYVAKVERKASPLPVREPLQMIDYAAWQRQRLRPDGEPYRATIAWYKERFERNIAMPDLPFQRASPLTGLDPIEGVISWPLDAALEKRLSVLKTDAGVTLYTVWLAALVALLAAETGQPSVVIGSYVTNRRRIELQNMIGCFSNLITLGFRVDFVRSFRQFLSDVRAYVTAAQAHGDIPHEELRRTLRQMGVELPTVSVIFGTLLGQLRKDRHFAGLTVARPPPRTPVAAMPWGFTLDLHEYDDGQQLTASFDAGRHDPVGVRCFIARLFDFLDAVSLSSDRSIGELVAMCKQQGSAVA
jgi:acyl carrier protein